MSSVSVSERPDTLQSGPHASQDERGGRHESRGWGRLLQRTTTHTQRPRDASRDVKRYVLDDVSKDGTGTLKVTDMLHS